MKKNDRGKDNGGKPPKPHVDAGSADARRAARNVKHIRAKIAAALDDPNKREQLVRAVRDMLNEDKS
jgi:hypothetical protein